MARSVPLDPVRVSADARRHPCVGMTTVAQSLGHGVHLVGSVPLASPEAVFRALAAEIGDRLRRIPDGETGPRSDWIVWQLPVFTTQRQLEVVPPGPPVTFSRISRWVSRS